MSTHLCIVAVCFLVHPSKPLCDVPKSQALVMQPADNHMECQQWFRELTADFHKRGSSLRPTRFEYRSN
jgi:hypothetical protein